MEDFLSNQFSWGRDTLFAVLRDCQGFAFAVRNKNALPPVFGERAI
jgi:hypothetical protein